MRKIAPLSAGFMLTSMIGMALIIAVSLRYDVLGTEMPVGIGTWLFTFGLLFIIMFIASVISMTNAPINDPAFYRELAIHNYRNRDEVDFEKQNVEILTPTPNLKHKAPKKSKK